MRRLRKWISKVLLSKACEDNYENLKEIYPNWNLLSLTPQYLYSEHRPYIQALKKAINDESLRNIALSGNYGVGKSSILKKISQLFNERVIELSLSTLAPIEEKNLDDSIPKQATTKTNRIQQEIVKQLLYREKPNKTPGSRFNRIERFNKWREIIFSFFLSLALTVLFLLTGWTKEIENEVLNFTLGNWLHLYAWLILFFATFTLRFLLNGRIFIKELTAGSATVTLDDKSVSYFDQYLDEIVYFFEITKYDIVIFEDIDRFDDPCIFETLRALNTLLNDSPYKTKKIRFIYAIKDSIFDSQSLNPSKETSVNEIYEPETIRANRTKFFDIIIPVVPFITYHSAKKLARQLLSNIDYEVDLKLVDLGTKYVPDMRLLKNTCNEFIVFHDRIFSGAGKDLKLSSTGLLAMMLYKGTHLSDFEQIRFGVSKLDNLYRKYREFVTLGIEQKKKKILNLRNKITNINELGGQSIILGEKLIDHINLTYKATRAGRQNIVYSFIYNGSEISADFLKSYKFWEEFVNAEGDPEIQYQNPSQSQYNLIFTRSHIEQVLHVSLSPQNWNKEEKTKLSASMEELEREVEFLRVTDIGPLIQRDDLIVEFPDTENINDNKGDSILSTFISKPFDLIAKEELGGKLAYHLVREGYINRNYILYTSTFHSERGNANVTNFIMQQIERNVMDEHYKLSPDEINILLLDYSSDSLQQPAFYNITILDYLLKFKISDAESLILSLTKLDDLHKKFIHTYLTSGKEIEQFIKIFTHQTSSVLIYLIRNNSFDEKDLADYVNLALSNMSSQRTYTADTFVSEYLKDNYFNFAVLTSEIFNINQLKIKNIINLFSRLDIKIPNLKLLSKSVIQYFIRSNLYEINLDNLRIVYSKENELSLDNAKEIDVGIYDYLKDNLEEYLDAIPKSESPITSATCLIEIVNEITETSPVDLKLLLSRVSCEYKILNIIDVNSASWPELAHNKLFSSSLINIRNYIDLVEKIDIALANLLISSQVIIDSEDTSDEEKERIAVIILSSNTTIPDASTRVGLVKSMNLTKCIQADLLPKEEGNLFALCLQENVIEDTYETYLNLLETDWLTRELFISVSKNIIHYMEPDIIRNDYMSIMTSEKIDNAVKNIIVNNAAQYYVNAHRADLALLAMYAIQQNLSVSLDMVVQLAENRVSSKLVLPLLTPHIQSIDKEQLFNILNKIGGDYTKLTTVGRERPSFENTYYHKALLNKLKTLSIIKKIDESSNKLKISKFHKNH